MLNCQPYNVSLSVEQPSYQSTLLTNPDKTVSGPRSSITMLTSMGQILRSFPATIEAGQVAEVKGQQTHPGEVVLRTVTWFNVLAVSLVWRRLRKWFSSSALTLAFQEVDIVVYVVVSWWLVAMLMQQHTSSDKNSTLWHSVHIVHTSTDNPPHCNTASI